MQSCETDRLLTVKTDRMLSIETDKILARLSRSKTFALAVITLAVLAVKTLAVLAVKTLSVLVVKNLSVSQLSHQKSFWQNRECFLWKVFQSLNQSIKTHWHQPTLFVHITQASPHTHMWKYIRKKHPRLLSENFIQQIKKNQQKKKWEKKIY